MRYGAGRKFRELFLSVVLIGGLSVTGCKRSAPSAPPPPVPEVTVIAVQPQSVVLTTELPGRTAPFLIAEIRPQVSGLIQKRLFTEGSDVKAGQVLYEIDPAPFQAALNSASANLDATRKAADQAQAVLNAGIADMARQQATVAFARTNRQRFEDLFKDKAVSALDRDQAVTQADVAEATLKTAEAQVQSNREAVSVAQAAIEQARAAMETAQINLDYTKITAPIPGRIGKSAVTDGAIVTAYQPVALATIQQLDPIYVDVRQSTNKLLELQRRMEAGQINLEGTNINKVKLLLDDGSVYHQKKNDQPLEGTLQFRDVSVDPSSTTVVLRMVFPNPEGVLLPGMFVRAVVTEGSNNKAILIPMQTVLRDPKGNPYVLIVNAESKVEIKSLELDRDYGNQWLISSGLEAGDRVIIEGIQKIRPGMPVKAVPFGEGKKPDAEAPKTAAQPPAKSN
ncbi:MAG: efflux RND transporter periplasmic adaptor subunit [Phycisphaerae bacterium]|nr:efflux RND transporter periplasmic adaptor subunit [Phycisphaerae bacterium]